MVNFTGIAMVSSHPLGYNTIDYDPGEYVQIIANIYIYRYICVYTHVYVYNTIQIGLSSTPIVNTNRYIQMSMSYIYTSNNYTSTYDILL